MGMMLLIGFLVLFVGPWIWMLVIIFRRSVIGGLLTLFFGFPVFYFLVTGWGEEGKDIKMPFFLGLLPFGLIFVLFLVFHDEIKKDMDDGTISAPASRAREARRSREAPAAAQAEPIKEVQPAQPAPVAQPAPALQPVATPRVPVQRAEVVKEPPRRQKAVQSNCVYKPVMTDEDMAKCR